MRNALSLLIIVTLFAACATFNQENNLVVVSECKPYKIVNGKFTLQCKKENLK